MRITTETRACIKCGRLLPVTEFRDYWYARTNVCNECKKLYAEKNYYERKGVK